MTVLSNHSSTHWPEFTNAEMDWSKGTLPNLSEPTYIIPIRTPNKKRYPITLHHPQIAMPRFSPRAPSSPPSPNSLLLHSLPPLSGSQYSPSLPASPLATLPPPLLRGCFPNRTVPLPPVTTGRCRLHSLLQASPSPQIQWDVPDVPHPVSGRTQRP